MTDRPAGDAVRLAEGLDRVAQHLVPGPDAAPLYAASRYLRVLATPQAAPADAPWQSTRECGYHHYTAENIAAIVRDLKAVEQGDEVPEWINRDHRTRCGILWRVISALAHDVPYSAQAAPVVQEPVAVAKLRAIVRWLEANQPDVFRRGLWDAIGGMSAHPPVTTDGGGE